MFSAIGLNLVKETNDAVATFEKKRRNFHIGLVLDLIAGVGLVLAAVYLKSPLAGTYTMIALGGLELGSVALALFEKMVEKTKNCCKACTKPKKQKYGIFLKQQPK